MDDSTSSPKSQGKRPKRNVLAPRSKAAPILAQPAIDLSARVSLSLREVAQVHNVSERTAWGWHDQGVLKGRKIGQVLRFDLEHVRALFRTTSDESEST